MKKRVVAGLVCLVVAFVAVFLVLRFRPAGDRFDRFMTLGAGYLQNGDATNAIQAYSRAVKLMPESIDARLNLANAFLLAGQASEVVKESQTVLNLDHNNPAAYYLMGCAYLRMNQAEQAVQALQQSQKIDPAVNALSFQLGLAEERLGHLQEAIQQFETLAQFDPEHPSVHYQLSRLYQRVDRTTEAAQELAKHQQFLAKNPNLPSGPAAYERCKYTEPRTAFALEQPDPRGVPVQFVEATASAFGAQASQYKGPIGVLDYNHDGRNSLFVTGGDKFRLLDNSGGRFSVLGEGWPGATNGPYHRCLVGDLNNDRFDDVLVLGEGASHAFRFATNGQFREVTIAAGLKNLKARDGLLADLDFTGKLDLLAVAPGAQGLEVFRNLGNFYFQESTNSGLPAVYPGIQDVFVDDWRDEDAPGVFVARAGQPPQYFSKQRAGGFVATNLADNLPAAKAIALGDLNNDLLLDVVLGTEKDIVVSLSGAQGLLRLPLKGLEVNGLLLVDYDNDGWLDILAYGSGLRIWRNLGSHQFEDVTASLGLAHVGPVDSVAAADFDQDGDTDLVTSSSRGLQYWRNDGGNANKQLKLRLLGNRSNASALGARVEFTAGHWRTLRTQTRLPFEIGVGKHDRVDLLKTRWFDLATTLLDVPVQPQPLAVVELMLPTGSCPYLYAWDGNRFRFVTDILGASPLGLPVSYTRLAEEDPEEFLALGNEQQFPPKADRYEVRVTEELREVLYLDAAELVAVDHPAGTLVYPTSKMRAAGPFPPHELWTLQPVARLQKATRNDGLDVTEALSANDCRMAGPVKVREPQLRGLAELFSITLDFGELPVTRSLVLVLNGWLRFGGGMANIAGSMDPKLPFPFPVLEAQAPDGSWKKVPTDVGVPAGKTKTILVDLEQRLPEGARRLRLSTAFELYWDSVLLCEKVSPAQNQTRRLAPVKADLHWRGFSRFAALPPSLPLTPDYDRVESTAPWTRTPSGWCTRYGPVDELVAQKDNALVLLNGGDEVSLSFAANRLPAKQAGFERDFFLYVVGWDKDADFHVVQGWRVEPLPFHGMDDQNYGNQPRPPTLQDSWIAKYNTRWVGPMVVTPQKR